jgi:hypothetical protein
MEITSAGSGALDECHFCHQPIIKFVFKDGPPVYRHWNFADNAPGNTTCLGRITTAQPRADFERENPAEERKVMTNSLHFLDATGDTRIEWNPSDPDEVAMARKAFKEAKDKKMLVYRVGAGNQPSELMREFDPRAERIIATRQTVGG